LILFCWLHQFGSFATHIDADVSVSTHVAKTASSRFAATLRIRGICHSVSKSILLTLVKLVLSKLRLWLRHSGGFTLAFTQLTAVGLNAAARIVRSAQPEDRIMLPLSYLHWLRVPQVPIVQSSTSVGFIVSL
jgi:hypothetical protein